MTKAKICHITKATGVAGSENHLVTLLTGLDKAKYQVTLVLLLERDKPLEDYVRRFEEGGVQVKRMLIRGDVDPLLVWRLYRLLREDNYDIVHTHLIHADLYSALARQNWLARPILPPLSLWSFHRGFRNV